MPVSARVTLGGNRLRTVVVDETAAAPGNNASVVPDPVVIDTTISADTTSVVRVAGPISVGTTVPSRAQPVVVRDFYLSSSGSDSNSGTSWTQAWATPQHAADTVPSVARVWMASGTYTVTSPVTYSGKAIWWLGPTMTADQIQAHIGNVVWEGSGSPARYFDISDASGGGVAEMLFSNRSITDDCIRLSNVTGFAFDSVYTHPTNLARNNENFNRPLLKVVGASSDGLRFLNCDSHSSPLIYARPTSTATRWFIKSPRSQSDVDQTYNCVDLVGDFDGLTIMGGYIEKSASGYTAQRIQMARTSRASRVCMIPGGFERLVSPYRLAKFQSCHLSVGWSGSSIAHNGQVEGTDCTGYVMAVSSELEGTLTSGEN